MFNHDKCRQNAEKMVSQMTMEERIDQLTYHAPAIDRLGVPAYNWWNEALHGVARAGTATVFPQAIALAAIFDEVFLREIADVIATEGRAKYNQNIKQGDHDIYKGLTFWSPNVNIFRDPRWGRGHETYGEDPYLSARLGVAFIEGLQGDGEVMKSAACAKHYAVHSGPEDLRHEFDAVVNDKDLWETYLPAFEACVKEADVEAVMGAYNRTNGEPCCGSPTLLEEILRKKWKFKGHVVSDCWAIRDFHEHHRVTKTPVDSVAMAMDAGCDLNCGNMYLHLKTAWMQGKVSDEQITEAAIRLFTTRYKLGMFEKTEFDQISYDMVECQAHLDLCLKAAEKSMVLLKNDGILPLDKSTLKTVGVIGPNANSRAALQGNYYGTASRYVTALEGILDYIGEDARVLYSVGCALADDRTESLALPGDRLSEAVTVAEHSDVVLMCLGLDESLEGEELDTGNQVGSGDKADLLLPEPQRELLEKVVATGKPVIVCLMAGSSIDLEFAQKNCAAVLQTWYPGALGGRAIANVIFGQSDPGGKLPVTFYKNSNEMTPFTDYNMMDSGKTYRYIKEEPLYPFGYGLTYGKLGYTLVRAEKTLSDTEDFVIELELNNDYDKVVEDVLQVYAQASDCKWAPPNPVLCAFKRVSVEPRKTQTVQIDVRSDAFTVINDKGEKIRPGGEWTMYVGFSQPCALRVALTGQTPLKYVVKQ